MPTSDSMHGEVRGQLAEVGPLLLPHGRQESSIGHQAWWQVPLSAESSMEPLLVFEIDQGSLGTCVYDTSLLGCLTCASFNLNICCWCCGVVSREDCSDMA